MPAKSESKESKVEKSGKDDRIVSGIPGLDEILEGGIPLKSLVLVSGATGTGKSIFSLQFVAEGALKGEPGVYVSLGESPEETMRQMRKFGWPIDKLVAEGKMLIIQPELYNFDALLTNIEDAVDRIKAKRLAIDSVSMIGMYFESKFMIRKSLLELSYLIKRLGCTAVAVSEIREGTHELSTFGIEEYVADGVIMLHFYKRGAIYLRAIHVRKMRGTSHSPKLHPLDIRRPGGMVIFPHEEILDDVLLI